MTRTDRADPPRGPMSKESRQHRKRWWRTHRHAVAIQIRTGTDEAVTMPRHTEGRHTW